MRGLVRRIAMPAAAAAVVFGGLVGTASSATAVDGDKPEPGLPYLNCIDEPPITPEPAKPPFQTPCFDGDRTANFFSWYNFAQVGLTGSVKAQQWTQIPLSLVAANGLFYLRSPNGKKPGEKFGNELQYLARAFFVSPDGSDDDYGTSAPITVRTVAFGSIPAEVTLNVVQKRDSDDLPVPLSATPHNYELRPPADRKDLSKITVVEPTTIDDFVNIRVAKIVVDGVDVGLQAGCETGPTARLSVKSPKLEVGEPKSYEGSSYFEDVFFDPLIHQFATLGGTLTGSVDIPSFVSCPTRTGDDVAPLLTAALSEKDNPVSIRLGTFTCLSLGPNFEQLPIPPGVNDPRDSRSGCSATVHPNDKVVTIPEQFDIPDTPVEPVTNQE